MDKNKDNQNFNPSEQTPRHSVDKDESCQVPEKIDNKIEKIDESAYAFNWEPQDKPHDCVNTEKRKTTSIYTLIMAISFVTVFLILTFFVFSLRDNTDTEITPTKDTSSPATSQSQKTIYIKEYDASSGILTPHEIYSNASASVVSIKASNGIYEGIGSGFVFSEGGYIATAEHVIHGMSEIKIITSEGEVFEATVINSDELTDLALLKIENDKLEPLEFGKSKELLVGDKLYAIGTPAALDFAGSMTGGELSFLNRKVSIYNDDDGSLKKRMTLLQTSAALNPGNSGGPIFDSYGKVVGIVTMKLGNNFDGISFAIPSDGAYNILLDMKNGIPLDDARRAEVATHAAKLGIKGESFLDGGQLGVKILEFSSSECDASKKLKVGDVIVSIDAKPVTDVSSLAETISNYSPGDTLSVTVLRASQLLTFSIILAR